MDKIYQKSHRIPWTINNAPHGLLDIIRGCNCKCVACYNTAAIEIKSYENVIKDFETITSLRPISSIGLIGGEPLLHPDLFKIIKYLKNQNVTVEILTNGVLLDEAMVKNLAEAGVDLIFLHIDMGQIRPDIHSEYSFIEIANLRTQKAKLLYENDIEVAMSVTIKKEQIPKDLEAYLEYFRQSPYINYFLLTLYKDLSGYNKFSGCLTKGITGNPVAQTSESPQMQDVIGYIYNKENIIPYWYMVGKNNKDYPRWVSYLSAASYDKKCKLKCIQDIKYSGLEENYIERYREKYKKYPFFKKQTQINAFIFIFLNALCGGYLIKNLEFLCKSFGKRMVLKRIFVQEPAYINENGVLEHCESCPDATVKNGKVVPVCVCDCFE